MWWGLIEDNDLCTHFNFKSIPAEQLGHHLGSETWSWLWFIQLTGYKVWWLCQNKSMGTPLRRSHFASKKSLEKKVIVLASVKKDVFWSGTQVQTSCVGERIPSLNTKFNFLIRVCSLCCLPVRPVCPLIPQCASTKYQTPTCSASHQSRTRTVKNVIVLIRVSKWQRRVQVFYSENHILVSSVTDVICFVVV